MRKLLIVPLTLLCLNSKAQQQDSLIQRMNIFLAKNIAATKQISFHLEKAHKQHSTGVGILITGLLIATGSTIAYSVDDTSKEANTNNYLKVISYVGLGMSFTGWGIIFDSHRHIGLAGKVKME